MKHITIVLVLLGMTLLTACVTQEDRDRAIAEHAGLPEEAFEHLDEFLLDEKTSRLLSVEQAVSVEPFVTGDSRFGEIHEVWCVVIFTNVLETESEVLWSLELNDRGWLAISVASDRYPDSNPLAREAGCANWLEVVGND